MSTSRLSSTPSSTLRPRAPRLISGLSDIEDSTFNRPASRDASRTRADDPEHNRQLSQANSLLGQRPNDPTTGPRKAANGRSTTRSSSGKAASSNFWGSSWSALQDLASDFLGDQEHTAATQRRPRRTSTSGKTRLFVTSPQASWGPTSSPTDYIATGSREEREAMVRTQKRKDMLSGAAASYPDSLGKFKRRMSDDGNSASTPPGAGDDRDADALVYLHTVQPGDTLAGITIRYNCSANILRRANRMWTNDTVQSRKVILLPVDACGTRGRRLTEHEADLLIDSGKAIDDTSHVRTPTAASGTTNGFGDHHRTESIASTMSTKPASSIVSTATEEPAWTHESWTILPNNEKPTEIVRLPRQTLGFFPPARRKSLSYSDRSSPAVSLDLNRPSYTDSLAVHEPHTAIADGVTPYKPDSIDQQRPRRGRLLSNATNAYFPSYLTGPGGVGTMNKNVRCPGPAQDGLNKLFASHLPNVAPPAHQQRLYMPDVPVYTDDDPAGGDAAARGVSPFGRAQSGVMAGALTPTPSNPGVPDLQQVGAAVEGWLRKFAVSARSALETSAGAPGHSGGRASPALSAVRGHHGGNAAVAAGITNAGPSGIGDLIEMADSFEIGGDEEDDEHDGGRGRGAGGNAKGRSGGKSGKAD